MNNLNGITIDEIKRDYEYKFDAEKAKEGCIQWIRDWFQKNGEGCNAVIGISGGKDSSVVAALCVEALGKDRVIGVKMPNGIQEDIEYADKLIDFLGIKKYEINIFDTINSIKNAFGDLEMSEQAKTNLPARIRMSTLYAVSQSLNGRVANTCNLSEDYIGYSTKYGDSAGDFSPLMFFTATEVKAIGYAIGLPKELIEKIPSDGLCGKTDEDNIGFKYEVLDRYIRTDIIEDENIKKKIDDMHKKNLFKIEPMQGFRPNIRFIYLVDSTISN